MPKFFIFLGLVAVWLGSAPSFACGVRTDCAVSNGDYRIYLPPAWESSEPPADPRGAIVFFHGWKGSSSSTISNKQLQGIATELGVALVAANGVNGSWSFHGSPSRDRNELVYVQAVLDDIAQRFSVDPDRVLATGFSIGASMVWHLSCFMGDRFAGFAPIAGTLWTPLPETCPSPNPHLFHYHGRRDGTFPLTGRPIAGGLFRQGNTYKSLDIWKTQGGCEADPAPVSSKEGLDCERSACGGAVLEICLHDGGHIYRADWIKRSWAQLTDIKGW